MTYTAHAPRLQNNAIIGQLADTGRPVGDADAPDSDRPYSVVYWLDDDPGELSQNDPHMVAWPVFQVTSVGDTREQAQWMQKQVRDALIGWKPSVEGYAADPVESLLSGRIFRDAEVPPAVFSAVDRFTFRIQAEPDDESSSSS